MRREDITPDIERRFWELTQKTNNPKECWEWKWPLYNGYGRLHLIIKGKGKRNIPAHRISWTIRYGTIGPDLCVCHSCDNRICVNPNHLWLGTKGHNTEDMWRKGRNPNAGWPPSARIFTPERRKKLSESHKARWAKIKALRAAQQT